jgi:hypothetical protein
MANKTVRAVRAVSIIDTSEIFMNELLSQKKYKKLKALTNFHAFTTCIASFLYSLLEYHAALRTIELKVAIFSNANPNK